MILALWFTLGFLGCALFAGIGFWAMLTDSRDRN